MPEGMYYVYTLSYPDGFVDEDGTDLSGVVFYVGKGTKILNTFSQRIDAHEADAKEGKLGRKCDVIRSIWATNMFVAKSKVYDTDDSESALRKESEFIALHSTPLLTNVIRRNKILVLDSKTRIHKKEQAIRQVDTVSALTDMASLEPESVFIRALDVIDQALEESFEVFERNKRPSFIDRIPECWQ